MDENPDAPSRTVESLRPRAIAMREQGFSNPEIRSALGLSG
ncbi:hypothetical protein CLV63_10536 [Murinocardiopsis flavida]|uniref:Homeodomain-like domain-containing protein n=1 Tax=Murinocardiopsis flavida TaxID=645275 RepID=A0A2P8DMD4_9ACTN|nr:hypothetical protein [Murinocardiopsis flavida]PSK98364.1 hypothetical protein CLV63_10536 [Murinocardiopsis flavida]